MREGEEILIEVSDLRDEKVELREGERVIRIQGKIEEGLRVFQRRSELLLPC